MTSRYRSVPLFFKGRIEEHLRVIAQSVNGILKGRQNNTKLVTLAVDAEETIISDGRFTPDSVVSLTPHTSSAAAALGLYVVAEVGKVTLYHDATTSDDRTFGLIYVG